MRNPHMILQTTCENKKIFLVVLKNSPFIGRLFWHPLHLLAHPLVYLIIFSLLKAPIFFSPLTVSIFSVLVLIDATQPINKTFLYINLSPNLSLSKEVKQFYLLHMYPFSGILLSLDSFHFSSWFTWSDFFHSF